MLTAPQIKPRTLPRRPALPLALATVILTGCAGGQTTPEDVREVEYFCDNGSRITVRFYPGEERAELMQDGLPVVLHQQPAGSGFLYSSGSIIMRGKGDRLDLVLGRALPLSCQVDLSQETK